MDLTLSGEHYFARLRVANHEFEKLFSLQSIQGNAPLGQWMALDPDNNPVLTENSVRSENAAVPIIREIMVATRVVKKLAAARILLKKASFSF